MKRLYLTLVAGVAIMPGIALAGSGDAVAYRPRATYRTGAGPQSVVIADVNRDGKPDLVVANSTDGTAAVLYGRGDGYFLTRTDYQIEGSPNLVVRDINLDGKPDILAANSGSVAFLAGNGGGTFKAPKVTSFDEQGFTSNGVLAVADFNRDSKLDVVLSYVESGFYLSLGDGRGDFAPLTFIGNSGFSFAAFVADVNRDGIPDLITTNENADQDGVLVNGMTILLGKGDGTFSFGQSFSFPGTGASAATAVDVNFDGKPDLVYILFNGAIVVSPGRGDGTFATPRSFPTGASPTAFVVADMNRDGKPDLVVANYGDNTVSVLRSNGDGTFVARQDFPTGHGPSSLAVADVNRDGIPDIVVTDSADNTVSVLLGTAP